MIFADIKEKEKNGRIIILLCSESNIEHILHDLTGAKNLHVLKEPGVLCLHLDWIDMCVYRWELCLQVDQ